MFVELQVVALVSLVIVFFLKKIIGYLPSSSHLNAIIRPLKGAERWQNLFIWSHNVLVVEGRRGMTGDGAYLEVGHDQSAVCPVAESGASKGRAPPLGKHGNFFTTYMYFNYIVIKIIISPIFNDNHVYFFYEY